MPVHDPQFTSALYLASKGSDIREAHMPSAEITEITNKSQQSLKIRNLHEITAETRTHKQNHMTLKPCILQGILYSRDCQCLPQPGLSRILEQAVVSYHPRAC